VVDTVQLLVALEHAFIRTGIWCLLQQLRAVCDLGAARWFDAKRDVETSRNASSTWGRRVESAAGSAGAGAGAGHAQTTGRVGVGAGAAYKAGCARRG